MAEWLFESGIGETRAALIVDGTIVEAAIELPGLREGTVVEARLVERLSPTLARVEWPGGEAMLDRPPPGLTLGRTLLVRITREALPEGRRWKRAKAVPAEGDAVPAPGPDLLARCTATGHPLRHLLAHHPDALEAAGWSEVLAEADTGEVAFAGGLLRIALTPAMTVIDIDGEPPLDRLAVAGATAAGEAILRLGLTGSIGIDFPTLANKAERVAVAAALDAALNNRGPLACERTAVNGFGFLQLIRPRRRMSLPEQVQADRTGAAARALLRQLERTPPGSTTPTAVHPSVMARIEREGWLAELARRTGVVPRLEIR